MAIIREISLDTEFLEAGRNPLTQAAQIMPASIALVDVFGKSAFYAANTDYDLERVENLLLNDDYSTLPDENPDLAARLLAFQKSYVLPKLYLDGVTPNSESKIDIDGKQFNLTYAVGTITHIEEALIDYLERTSNGEDAIRLWARQGASDQIVFRACFNGLMPLKEQLKGIGLKLLEGEIKDIELQKRSSQPPEEVAHNCLYDAAYDAHNIEKGLEPKQP